MKSSLRSSFVFVCVFLIAVSVLAAEKRPMQPLDVLHLRSVSSGDISPDGQWTVFALAVLNWEKGKRYTDIYVSSIASGEQRRMTFTEETSEESPAWARDSLHFAFLSDRADGKTKQLYLMRRDGGEARPASGHKGPVRKGERRTALAAGTR